METLIILMIPLTYLAGFLYTPAVYIKMDRHRLSGRRYRMIDSVGDLDPVHMFIMCLLWPAWWVGWVLLWLASRELRKDEPR